MTKARHLTDEALLEAAGKRLSAEAQLEVAQHLKECEYCRKHYDNLRFAHSVFERLAEVGLPEVLGEPVLSPSPVARPASVSPVSGGFVFPWGPVAAIVFGCVCVLAVLFYPSAVPQANATELLATAMQRQDQQGADEIAFQLEAGGKTCAGGKHSEEVVSFESSLHCNRALQDVKLTQWGHGNPLSVRTYAAWRGGLHRHKDRVTKEQASWDIYTTTEEGSVHAASLEMRASDYHPTKLTLDFEDSEEVSIAEALQPLPPAPSADIATAKPLPEPRPVHIDDPADLLEVQSWILLHQLNADSGWDAAVVRNGSHVQVEAVVDSDNRKQQFLKAFASNREIELGIHSPTDPVNQEDIWPERIRPDGDGPALAVEWLEQQFPDKNIRETYRNKTLRLSRQILGHAFFVSRLQERQKALRHCSCAKDLSTLLAKEELNVLSMQAELSSSIEPLIGSPNHSPSKLLTPAQAQQLDTALAELLFRAAAPGQAVLDARLQQIRDLL